MKEEAQDNQNHDPKTKTQIKFFSQREELREQEQTNSNKVKNRQLLG
jgi:hypothetical protein